MSKKLIDNVFTYDSYRYVPEDLKLEWKTLYNYYSVDYFNKQHKIHKIYPQYRIDIYNEEVFRVNRLLDICYKFKDKITKIQPKYSIDINHSKRMQKELTDSNNKIIEFLNNKIKKTNKIIKKNKIPLTHTRETFEDYNLNKVSQNKYLLIVIIVLIYILFILLLNNN